MKFDSPICRRRLCKAYSDSEELMRVTLLIMLNALLIIAMLLHFDNINFLE